MSKLAKAFILLMIAFIGSLVGLIHFGNDFLLSTLFAVMLGFITGMLGFFTVMKVRVGDYWLIDR